MSTTKTIRLYVPFSGKPVEVAVDSPAADASYFQCACGSHECQGKVYPLSEAGTMNPPYTSLDCIDRMADEIEGPAPVYAREVS